METNFQTTSKTTSPSERKSMCNEKRVLKTLFLIMLLFSGTICYAQSSEKTEIPIKINRPGDDTNEKELPKRDLDIEDILPTMYYYSTTEEIGIVSNFVTFEDVAYEICNEQGATILSDTISLPKNEEVFVSTASLPSGKYYIYIIIDEQSFVGELQK